MTVPIEQDVDVKAVIDLANGFNGQQVAKEMAVASQVEKDKAVDTYFAKVQWGKAEALVAMSVNDPNRAAIIALGSQSVLTKPIIDELQEALEAQYGQAFSLEHVRPGLRQDISDVRAIGFFAGPAQVLSVEQAGKLLQQYLARPVAAAQQNFGKAPTVVGLYSASSGGVGQQEPASDKPTPTPGQKGRI